MNEKKAETPAVKQTAPAQKQAAPTDQKQTPPATPGQPKDASPKLIDITSAYIKKKELFDRNHETLVKRIDSSRQNIERIQSSLTKAELQLSQLVEPSVKDDLVDPLARELLKLMPDCAGVEVMGPLGIQAALTLTFAAKGATDEEKLAGTKCRSITLITKKDGGGIGVRDYSKDTKAYAPGSIGYASGLNHPVVPVPADAGIRFLLDWIK